VAIIEGKEPLAASPMTTDDPIAPPDGPTDEMPEGEGHVDGAADPEPQVT
jgi:hypothetical protein